MLSTDQFRDFNSNSGSGISRIMKITMVAIAVIAVLTIVIFGLAIATLVKINQNKSTTTATISGTSTMAPTTTSNTLNSVLAESVRIQDVMSYLNALQRIGSENNGNRAVTTSGFNETLDYITNSLSMYTDYSVTKIFFPIRQFALASNPIFMSSINGVVKNYTYSDDLSVADFYHIQFSIATNFSSFQQISVIPGVGCSDDEWSKASSPPAGKVALVKRGICGFSEKSALAAKYNAQALLIYNDGTTPERVPPIAIGLGQENDLPALFLSFTVGQELADAAQNASTNTGVRLIINVQNLPLSPVGNICADTRTGDPTQTIVIGSHSDSVPAGPGINDNGSGSAANLALAIALARLFQTSSYEKYKYRVRFCWWGAEEIGLLGSDYHVKQAKIATTVGDRVRDYLINLNYDMLGSPNFIFGLYDAQTANNNTPTHALPGSNKISTLFRDWFNSQKLPWTNTAFDGRSDYGPFLAEGVVAGGLFSGADATKTPEERNRYDQMLGQGMGGIAGATYDPCYHQACDSIQNINPFAYEKMVQAAAYVLEYLARQNDLATWLYPNGRPTRSHDQASRHKYNSINEFFGMPYL